uniref:Uncharacterized protein n=1 Tax=Magallana gigas TaxID=29159 RepID=K1QEI6_MAGGI
MAVREVLPEEYDELDQRLEKELPLSICLTLFLGVDFKSTLSLLCSYSGKPKVKQCLDLSTN